MLLGIDFGMKRVGLAVAPVGGPAAPFNVIEWGKGTALPELASIVSEVLRIAAKEGATQIVVGSPSRQPPCRSLASTEPHVRRSLASTEVQEQWRQEVEKFVKALHAATIIPVVTEDERMSTKLAARLTGYKGVADQDAVAAAVILQGYLERSRHGKL